MRLKPITIKDFKVGQKDSSASDALYEKHGTRTVNEKNSG